MKFATWNVNSIRARLDHVLAWLEAEQPDVLCMQETKVEDDDFPSDEMQLLGYAVAMTGQPAYNGVAIASRLPMKEIQIGMIDPKPDAEPRLLSATVAGLRVMSAYVPNGRSTTSPAFAEKLSWLRQLRLTLLEREAGRDVFLGGDFNVASDERDLYDPEAMPDDLRHAHDQGREQQHHRRAIGRALRPPRPSSSSSLTAGISSAALRASRPRSGPVRSVHAGLRESEILRIAEVTDTPAASRHRRHEWGKCLSVGAAGAFNICCVVERDGPCPWP